MTPTVALNTLVRTRTGRIGKVVGYSTADVSRVVVSTWNGWRWMLPRGYDVAALEVMQTAPAAEATEAA